MTCQGTMIDNLFTIAVVLLAILSAEKCHLQAQCCEEYCYTLDNERPQLAHFGTKTANKVSRGSETGRQFIVPGERNRIRMEFLEHVQLYEFQTVNR